MNNNNYTAKNWEEDEYFKLYLKEKFGTDHIPFTGQDILDFIRDTNPRSIYSEDRNLFRISHKHIYMALTTIFEFFVDSEHALDTVLKPDFRFIVEDNNKLTIYQPEQVMYPANVSEDDEYDGRPIQIVFQGRTEIFNADYFDIPIDCIQPSAIKRYLAGKAEKIERFLLTYGKLPVEFEFTKDNCLNFYVDDKQIDVMLYTILLLNENDGISESFIYTNNVDEYEY